MVSKQECQTLKMGELLHLPAEVSLMRFVDGKDGWGKSICLKETMSTHKPTTVPFLGGVKSGYGQFGGEICEILYNGEKWYVRLRNIFRKENYENG